MLQEFWSWYLRSLETDPFKTKAFTSAFFKSLSETTAQKLKGQTKIEWNRVWAFALFGIFVDTPFCQFWYSRLPRLTTMIAGSEKKTHALVRTGVSTVLDTLIFSPVFYVLYFLFFGFASGTYKNLSEAIEDIKVKLFPAWSAGTKVWPAANFFTMFLLPQKLWMPANNLVAYAFNIYLSLLNSSSKKKKSTTPKAD